MKGLKNAASRIYFANGLWVGYLILLINLLLFSFMCSNGVTTLNMSWWSCCRGICKILTWCDKYCLHESDTNVLGYEFINSLEHWGCIKMKLKYWNIFLMGKLTMNHHRFSDNGLSPNRWQYFIWTNDGIIYWRHYVSLGLNESTKLFDIEAISNTSCPDVLSIFSGLSVLISA